MSKIFSGNERAYVVLPKKRALVYVELENNSSITLLNRVPYTIDVLASENLNSNKLSETYSGSGRMILSLSTNVYRGRKGIIDPNIVSIDRTGLENYLGASPNINPKNKSISELAKTIQNQLSLEKRNNPYFLTTEIISWINKNIEYTVVPKSIIKSVENVISKLPFENRINSYEILKKGFNFDENSLQKMISQISLNNSLKQNATNYQIAKTILDQVGGKWIFFQEFWSENNGLSAERTLQNGYGKCVGMANLFVALSRNLGIPSERASGYASDIWGINQSGHAWAVSNISPYGWIDFDPTANVSIKFKHDNYAYTFSEISDKNIRFTLVNTDPEVDSRVSDRRLDEMINLLEKNNSNGALSGSEKYQREIKSLRLLQKLYS